MGCILASKVETAVRMMISTTTARCLVPAPGYPTGSTTIPLQEYRGEPCSRGRPTPRRRVRLGHFVIADTATPTIAQVSSNGFASGGDVHEFLLTPEGTAFIILYQAVDWDMTPAGGSMYGAAVDGIVQEIEVETGRVLFEWHALDHIGVEDSYIAIPGQDPDRPSDFVHMNSITIAPDGDLILSMRHTAAV